MLVSVVQKGCMGVIVEQLRSAFEVLKEELPQLKWRVLFTLCLTTWGSYYIYDFPGTIGTGTGDGTIERRFVDAGKTYSQEMNQVLYSVYSWPNVILAFIWGILADRVIGMRRTLLLGTGIVLSSSILFYIGVVVLSFPTMVLGRVLFGIGGESLTVVQGTFVSRWFKQGRGFSLAFGLTITFLRAASATTFSLSPQVADTRGVCAACLVGVVFCAISFASAVLCCVIDKYAEGKGIVPPEQHTIKAADGEKPTFGFIDIVKLPLTMWLIGLSCFAVYSAIFPFIDIGENFFEVKYNISETAAGEAITVHQFTSAVLAPILGGVIDVTGGFTWWMISSAFAFVGVHTLFIVAHLPPKLMMFLFGTSYSVMVASYWPVTAYAVPDKLVGTAYGLETSLQNTGIALLPLITGAILDAYTPASNTTIASNDTSDGPNPTPQGFNLVELFFIGGAILAIISCVALIIVDRRMTGGALSASLAVRRKLLAPRDPNDANLDDENHVEVALLEQSERGKSVADNGAIVSS